MIREIPTGPITTEHLAPLCDKAIVWRPAPPATRDLSKMSDEKLETVVEVLTANVRACYNDLNSGDCCCLPRFFDGMEQALFRFQAELERRGEIAFLSTPPALVPLNPVQ